MTGRNYAAPCAVPWQSVGLLRASYHKEQCWAPRTDSIKVIFWCQINPGSQPTRSPRRARPTACPHATMQWTFLESDTYSFLIDICQKYWHFDLLASYGPGRRCVVHHPPLGTAVWTIGFKKMVIGEPEKKNILKKYLLSAYWILLQLNFQWHKYGQFFIFPLLQISC